jgi:peptidoglycan/xylan/chitin deacetylase (PgdA/CDA1 family)
MRTNEGRNVQLGVELTSKVSEALSGELKAVPPENGRYVPPCPPRSGPPAGASGTLGGRADLRILGSVTPGRTVRDRLRLRPKGPVLPTVAILALIGAVVAGAGNGPQQVTTASDRTGPTTSAAGPFVTPTAGPSGASAGWDQAVARSLSSTSALNGSSSAAGAAASTPLTGHPDQRLAPPVPPVPPLPCPQITPGYLDRTPPTAPRTVALTFDDGPGPWTPKFLAVLAKYHVHGTFFMVAGRAQSRPDLVAQVVDSGSLVGNHTWSHPLHPGLSQLPSPRVAQEIGSAQTMLTQLSGSAPCFFRGPGEDHRNAYVQGIAHRYGLTVTDTTRTAADSVNPRNVTYDPAWRDLIVTRLTAAGDHPIVLMHDGHNDDKVNELSALERIIVWYKSRGYVFTDPAGRPFPTR